MLGLSLVINRAMFDMNRHDHEVDDLPLLLDQGLVAQAQLHYCLLSYSQWLLLPPCAGCTEAQKLDWGNSPWLVGIEGVMPIAKLERMVFGNFAGRLTYEPSSTPYS